MVTSTDPVPHPTPRPRRRRARTDRPRGDRPVVLAVAAGLGAVLLLTAMAVLTGQETTATVAVTAVGTIITAALTHPRR